MTPIGLENSCQIRIEAKGPQTSGCTSQDPHSIHAVAQEFESLLIGQMLKSVKLGELSEDGNGTNGSMMEFARENLARLISQNGGIGMAHFLENALNRADAATSGLATSSLATSGLATSSLATSSSTAPVITAPGVIGTTEVGTPVPAETANALNLR
jgi:Rod binding domain-containing protein